MAKKHPATQSQTLPGMESVAHMPEGFYSGDQLNPCLREFVNQHRTDYEADSDKYAVPPFRRAINTTKATSLFNLHSYFSKKPHEAIRQYIRHYTSPGDIVLDPFCGSGGTAVSALLDERAAIGIDRSPAATFITKNYCTSLSSDAVRRNFDNLQRQVKDELDWLYETKCHRCGGNAVTAFTVYSQVFQCPRCLERIALFDCVASELTAGTKKKKVKACPHCFSAGHTEPIRSQSEKFGHIPVEAHFICQGGCKPARGSRRHNDPDDKKRRYFEEEDLARIQEIQSKDIPYWYPKGYDMTGFSRYQRDALFYYCVKEVADLFTKRNLWALALLRQHSTDELRFTLSSIVLNSSRMYRHRTGGGGGPKGTDFMIPQIGREMNVWPQFEGKAKELCKAGHNVGHTDVCISTQNAYDLSNIANDSIDYVFTDPPYGGTIQYGELSVVWEAWQGFDPNWREEEITIAAVRSKSEHEWADLMRKSMAECYRVLKPGRWLSLCYHDTSEGTWALVQDVMTEAGFIVDKSGDVLFIDTGQKTYNQYTADKSTKRDLVLNFRKPRPGEVAVSHMSIPAGADTLTFQEMGQQIIREFLTEHPGASKDRIYDELVSRMVRRGEMEAHDFDGLLCTVAEEVGEGMGTSRWYLMETADRIDKAEQEKEDSSAKRLERFMVACLEEHPELEGIHYSDLFEQIITTPPSDRPRRRFENWLLEYFFKTSEGTWRPPADETERQQKAAIRQAGTLRRMKRFANALIDGVPVRDQDRPDSAHTLAEWIRQCRRAGLYEQGRTLFEKGGLELDRLDDDERIEVEDDYRLCVKRGNDDDAKKKSKGRKKKKT